ncbi:MAG: 30S ribosomal protein S6 [Deltaproteobacteria bacterium]|nr:30S ribosomal protein S6 [Deltaproteobacteria bacterium]
MATAAAAAPIRWAREYETIYILRSDVDNAGAEKVVGRAKDVIARLDGTLTKLDNWGKRKLAYPIQKSSRGIFVYLKYVGYGDLVAELERNLRLLDEVVRFQTVLLEENIDPSAVAVDPEEVQYLHVEEEEDSEDAELERARSLGMAPRAPRPMPTEAPKQSDAAPQGAAEAPAAEAAAAEAPAAEAAAAEAPAAEAAAAEAPAAEAAAAEAPAAEAPAAEAAAAEAPAAEAAAAEAAAAEAPAAEAPAAEAAAAEAAAAEAPAAEAPAAEAVRRGQARGGLTDGRRYPTRFRR